MTQNLTTLPNRSVLSLSGPDTLTLLERLVTNNTTNWNTGEARYGALLTPQGKVIADFIAVRTDDGVLLDVAKDASADLAKRLKMFRLRSDVKIEPRDDLAVAVSDTPLEGKHADPRSENLPHRAFVPTRDEQEAGNYNARRLTHGIPEQGLDFGNAEVFPADINMDLLGGVDLKKGCFVGQEVVSRMHRRGNIRRRTIVLTGTGLTTGAKLLGDALLGEVTSTDGNTALARVRVDRLAKSVAGGHALSVNDNHVTFEEPDWLQHEMAAFLKS